MGRGYEAFASFYDLFTQNVNYKIRADYFNSLVKKYAPNLNGNILLDLGCGTGRLSEEFYGLGYDVIGVDNSYEMLAVANENKLNSGSDILYLQQDITSLDMYGTYDIAISALDTVNHLENTRQLEQTFSSVSLFLHPDGIFIFDCNTLYKHQKILANNTFVYEDEKAFLVWQNELQNDKTVELTLDIFAKTEEGFYVREQEQFCERVFTEDEISAACDKANLEVIDIFAEDSFNQPKNETERLIYIVKKKKEVNENG